MRKITLTAMAATLIASFGVAGLLWTPAADAG